MKSSGESRLSVTKDGCVYVFATWCQFNGRLSREMFREYVLGCVGIWFVFLVVGGVLGLFYFLSRGSVFGAVVGIAVCSAYALFIPLMVGITLVSCMSAVVRRLRDVEKLRVAGTRRPWEEEVDKGDRFYNGDGVEEDHVEAFKWYKRAAEHGHVGAQCVVGYCYYKGDGVRRNRRAAFLWYRQAADHGSREALYNLGLLYANGRGVKQNREKARELFQRAADMGDNDAARELAELSRGLDNEHLGVKGVFEEQRVLTEAGDAKTMFEMGLSYETGHGVSRNRRKAFMYFLEAAKKGHLGGRGAVEDLYRELRWGAEAEFLEHFDDDMAKLKREQDRIFRR